MAHLGLIRLTVRLGSPSCSSPYSTIGALVAEQDLGRVVVVRKALRGQDQLETALAGALHLAGATPLF